VGELGLLGDEQADLVNHGGPDQAVYLYAREDLDYWGGVLGRHLRDGMFGENLTTLGLDLTGARIGERWRIGSVLGEVTSPRIPCGVFRSWMGEQGWVKRFAAEGRTGAYLRVLETGDVGPGDAVELVHRPDDAPTTAEAVRAYYGDAEQLRRILAVPTHSAKWDAHAKNVLGRA
jgi:MOSC domain-containing protein YiiM